MFAGLPGTGIGGIFYLLLTLWMPVHECYLALRGRSSLSRWKFIALRWTLFALVIAVMWAQVELLKSIFPQGAPEAGAAVARGVGGAVGLQISADSTGGLLIACALWAGLVLVAVLLAVHLIRLTLWYRERLAELAYEEDFAGEWKRFKAHIAEHAASFTDATTNAWTRFEARVRSARETARSVRRRRWKQAAAAHSQRP